MIVIKILPKTQNLLWARIWMLLYLFQHSKPEVANAVWELLKVLDGAKQAAFLKMHHVIKYILDLRNLGLKLEPSRNEKEPFRRRRRSKFILCVFRYNYAWQSKAQRNVTSSNPEAEWIALLEAISKIIFMIKLLRKFWLSIQS